MIVHRFNIKIVCLLEVIQLVWYFTVCTDEEELHTDDIGGIYRIK
jgi:hypothetical protein